ncbi:MAG: FUN14 domain-containing protein [Candidatus Bruticola sp.]
MDETSVAAGAGAAVFPWQACLLQLSGGTIAGMAVGYSLKAALRSALLVLGSVLLLLALLSHAGFITVNWGAICCSIENGTRAAGELVSDLGSQLSSSMAGFAAGAMGGWKMHR